MLGSGGCKRKVVSTVGQRALDVPVGEADDAAAVGALLLEGAVGEGHHTPPITIYPLALAIGMPDLLPTCAMWGSVFSFQA